MKSWYLPDIAAGVLIAVLSVIWCLEMNPLTLPFFIGGCVTLWCLIQYFYYKKLLKTGVLTDAVLMDYHHKLEKQRPMYGGSVVEYTTYAPVMQYETESEVITSRYCIHLEKRKYEIGKTYQIYYLPSMPELFWFPDGETAVYGKYLITICAVVIVLIICATSEGK